MICFLFAELDEVLGKLGQGPSMPQQQQPRVSDTTDTSGEDTDVEQPRRQVRSRRTFKMKKGYAVGELAQFFVTGPTDAANRLSEFYCRVCRKEVSVRTHGEYEIIRQFQGHRHFSRDQRLRLETPGWRVLDFDGNPLPEDELERQRERIMLAPPGARISFSRGSDSGCLRKRGCAAAIVGQSLVLDRCSAVGWELRAGKKTVEALCVDGQPDQCDCCLVPR